MCYSGVGASGNVSVGLVLPLPVLKTVIIVLTSNTPLHSKGCLRSYDI